MNWCLVQRVRQFQRQGGEAGGCEPHPLLPQAVENALGQNSSLPHLAHGAAGRTHFSDWG